MNANTDPAILELVEHKPAETLPAVAENSPAALMMRALDRGATPEQVGQMMALQERWEANEARKAYNVAFAQFKAEAVQVLRNRKVTDGPLKGKAYAELYAVVDAVTPALAKHGLSASWKVTKDEKDWIEVTCTLTHAQGHSESVSMGGPPDTGGAKNALQARGSTKSYLERYTLKAICGVAEGAEDDDGAGGAKEALVDTWVKRANEAQTYEETTKISREGTEAFNKAKDVEGYRQFASALQQRRNTLKKGAGNA
jgi:hypothetical protein